MPLSFSTSYFGLRSQTKVRRQSADLRAVRDSESNQHCSRSASTPQRPVQRAVVDGFEDVVTADAFAGGEIGQCPGHLQDAVMGAGAEVALVHGVLEIAGAFGVEFAMLADEARRHGAVGVNLPFFGESLALDGAGGFDALADGLRAFGLLFG